MITLRPYQRAAIDAVLAYWRDGGGNPLVEAATGTGKSAMIATLTRELLEQWPDMRVLMLVHVRELVEQNAMALLRLWPGAPLGINSAGLGRRDNHARVLFASVQSVYRRAGRIGPRDLVIVDECHLVPQAGDGMYRSLLDALRDATPDLRVAGFTATPYRLDSGRLDTGSDRLFDRIVYSYGIAQGVTDGYLSPLTSKATLTGIDVSGVARRGGEFVESALQEAVDRADVTEGAADEIVQLGQERQSWLVFCAGVQHAYHVRDAIRRRGVSCEAVTGDMAGPERDRIIRAFRAGQIRCLTNAMVLTTGFDAPGVDLIAMLRPTLSTGLYVQICGRGTRLADGKTDCLVLDFAGNVRRHGPVDAIEVSSGGGRGPGEKGDVAVKPETVRAKVCPHCSTYVGLAVFECPSCGYEWERPKPKHEAKADAERPVMAMTAANPWLDVAEIEVHLHEKEGAPPSVRVEYQCGMRIYREWVTLEHRGYAGERAAVWWRCLVGGPAPPSVQDALDILGEDPSAIAVTHIQVKPNGRYFEVCGYRTRTGYEFDNKFRRRRVEMPTEAAA